MKLAESAWLGVEIRHLSALEAVASERSFSRAAKKLGYTQSAISGQIATLERAVGERLLERGVGQSDATPTPAGHMLLNHAQTISARMHAAEADLSAIRDQRHATLRVGIYQSVGATILPEVVERLRDEAPGVRLELYEAGNERNLSDLVQAGELDVAFDVPPVRPASLHVAELLSDPFVLLLADDVPGRPDLSTPTLAAFKPCAAQAAAEDRLREWGVDPERILRLEDARAILTLVAERACNALLPRLAVGETALPVRRLPPTMPRRTVLLVWHRYRTVPPATATFVQIAQAVSAAYGAAA
ncbi:MAG: LysR family transcriptional regulator [Actinobacteria bacterium]|nr:LysR family transcriptional regulator [Actinomycetota bacterium]